jgi:hypothetical protein
LFGKKPLPARTVVLEKGNGPAVDLEKVRRDGNIDLAKKADAAGISLEKRGLSGIRAQALLVLDHSGSMHGDYSNGKVQKLVERVLGFALQIDADGTVPVIPFDTKAWPSTDVSVDNYRGAVNRDIWRSNNMGSTNLAAALDRVRQLAEATDAPIFCAVVTDGSPDSRAAATTAVCELARYPVFLKFLALGHVPYLAELDNLPAGRRLIDNVNSKPGPTGPGLLTCTDEEFAEAMADEWNTWVSAAKSAGILQ